MCPVMPGLSFGLIKTVLFGIHSFISSLTIEVKLPTMSSMVSLCDSMTFQGTSLRLLFNLDKCSAVYLKIVR